MLWEPVHFLPFKQTINEWFCTIEVTRLFLFQVNDEENIIPHIVVILTVEHKTLSCIFIKLNNKIDD